MSLEDDLRKIASEDQLETGLKAMAKAIWIFYRELRDQNMPSKDALKLSIELLHDLSNSSRENDRS